MGAIAGAWQLSAQSTPGFEAVSIKANRTGQPQMVIRTPPSGLVTAVNVTVHMLVRYVHGLPEYRVRGGPAWTTQEHFDLTARGPAQASLETTRAMMAAVLTERFGVVTRPERVDMPVDTLLSVTAGRTTRLRPASQECEPAGAGVAPERRCGLREGYGQLDGLSVSMQEVAAALARQTRRHVVDATGLDGRFDLTLRFTPDALALTPSLQAQFPAIDPNGPSLNTALEEQLGLRLQSGRGPVEVVVIERAERPTFD